ncbi:3',5'-cyclic AMP phosphodiesterase CpdA [Luteibacter jiangsuensis]|uniref:3',5'-cyclic AMP phosphodiesterase CpdA n=1 Tax=Luteibacter jiangsuensis TaxID=637577 RepID=A0ABT9T0B1_9GAMM|nr:metallophosphoesterase [Luteibacter jiangsuensis]MDQ0010041.1 3',5'-cyclic AMP phosphodiesterase CpdA [Luteibacter jiangsuensis]
MSLIVQISDPHFGTERPDVVAALQDAIVGLRPDLVILSGDVTQRARHRQFTAARRFVDGYERPTLVIPGNHDVPLFNLFARVLDPFGAYRRAFGDDLEPEFDNGHVLAIGVNTVRPSRHKDGAVSDEQIERVCRRLARAREEQLRIVVTHQPVHVIREKDIANLLVNHERAIAAWAAAGADLVLGGHIHLPYVRPLDTEKHRLANPLWAVQAGTAVSRRIREGIGNSFHVIRHEAPRDRGACVVEQWDYGEGERRFVAGVTTQIRLGRFGQQPSPTGSAPT